jgi:hypothetical protein
VSDAPLPALPSARSHACHLGRERKKPSRSTQLIQRTTYLWRRGVHRIGIPLDKIIQSRSLLKLFAEGWGRSGRDTFTAHSRHGHVVVAMSVHAAPSGRDGQLIHRRGKHSAQTIASTSPPRRHVRERHGEMVKCLDLLCRSVSEYSLVTERESGWMDERLRRAGGGLLRFQVLHWRTFVLVRASSTRYVLAETYSDPMEATSRRHTPCMALCLRTRSLFYLSRLRPRSVLQRHFLQWRIVCEESWRRWSQSWTLWSLPVRPGWLVLTYLPRACLVPAWCLLGACLVPAWCLLGD